MKRRYEILGKQSSSLPDSEKVFKDFRERRGFHDVNQLAASVLPLSADKTTVWT